MIEPALRQTPQSYLRTITIIHLALVAGQVLFGLVVVNITKEKGIDVSNTKDPFLFVVPVMAIFAIAGGIFIFKKLLTAAINKNTLKEKLMAYQSALIVRYSLLQGVSMLGIVVNMLTGNLFYLVISAVLTLGLILLRPTKDKIESDLNLTYEDKMLFDSTEPL